MSTRMPAPLRRRQESKAFLDALERHIDFAFQPIVSLESGRCYGVEALMRGWQATGLAGIEAVLDRAHGLDVLVETDALLKHRAFAKFMQLPHAADMRLFFNLDNRLFNAPTYRADQTLATIADHGLEPSSVVLEVSERKRLSEGGQAGDILSRFRDETVQTAIDDFGTGFSGLALLYDTHPEYVKIDRFFISSIGEDRKKKAFVSHIVSLAKVLGIRVIAEGIESETEFMACRELGCDLVQGYLIQRPTTALDDIRDIYPEVARMRRRDRRAREKGASHFVQERLDRAPTLDARMRMEQIFESFRINPQRSFFPFLGRNSQPIGVIREIELKEYIYSPYGRDLLSRKRIGEHLDLFVRQCPVADIHTPIDTLIEQYSISPSRDGMLITADGIYQGVLSAESLLLAVQERNLELARDQNPLTGLAGNPSIERFIESQQEVGRAAILVYFDLDNFKAFNDTYGFRLGDRAIRLFADLLKKMFAMSGAFIGHVGGDDFFVGVAGTDFERVHAACQEAIERFGNDARSFYSEEHRRSGGVPGIDREGRRREFALLSASCSLVCLDARSHDRGERDLITLITRLKKECKHTGHCVVAASAL